MLHEVLDVWFAEQVAPRLRARARLVRFADDFVVICQHEADARRVMDVLQKRYPRPTPRVVHSIYRPSANA